MGTRESRANPPSRSWIVVGRGSLDEENEKRKWSVNARAVRRAADRASRACHRGLHDCTARTHPIARRALIAKIICTMRAERLPRTNAPPLHCGPIVGSFFQKRFPWPQYRQPAPWRISLCVSFVCFHVPAQNFPHLTAHLALCAFHTNVRPLPVPKCAAWAPLPVKYQRRRRRNRKLQFPTTLSSRRCAPEAMRIPLPPRQRRRAGPRMRILSHRRMRSGRSRSSGTCWGRWNVRGCRRCHPNGLACPPPADCREDPLSNSFLCPRPEPSTR